MPVTYTCSACGFVLYRGTRPKSYEDVCKQWGYVCPVCMSALEVPGKSIKWKFNP
ncbi:hypothetical protein GCM10007981_18970 [Thermocladium modestius]|uniref:Uncharacterized protein n=1 Tax=Thermocladium modestius TaxID=62609 RepID=A0A830GYU7_9CREN|nr:hypothetical protein [Thermocladium modestius]GGP22531.1 hypothetical protein GCM10007981_18970 [Thermocladium modestius]